MARLEDLIADVENPVLREALAHEVKTLKQRTRFGLVFERHLPESVLLPASAGLDIGDQVRLRDVPEDRRELRILRRSNDKVVYVTRKEARPKRTSTSCWSSRASAKPCTRR